MAHTYTLTYHHIVFSTKLRRNLIRPEWESELHAIFRCIARNKGFSVDCSGGTENHVHLLIRLPANVELSKAVQLLKGSSSRWAGDRENDFAWQQGYAAFSVSFSALDQVRRYIRNQKQHHLKISFEDEFRTFLKKHGIEYDEQYVFG